MRKIFRLLLMVLLMVLGMASCSTEIYDAINAFLIELQEK